MRREYRVTVAYVKAGQQFELVSHVMASSPGMAITEVLTSGRRDVRSGVQMVRVHEAAAVVRGRFEDEGQEAPAPEAGE